MSGVIGIKTAIRTCNYAGSREFYQSILLMPLIEEWEAVAGNGCILRAGDVNSNSFLELQEVGPGSPYFQETFSGPQDNDKINLQIEIASMNEWLVHLKGRWPSRGPEPKAWGATYLYLRDPDNIEIILYQK